MSEDTRKPSLWKSTSSTQTLSDEVILDSATTREMQRRSEREVLFFQRFLHATDSDEQHQKHD